LLRCPFICSHDTQVGWETSGYEAKHGRHPTLATAQLKTSMARLTAELRVCDVAEARERP